MRYTYETSLRVAKKTFRRLFFAVFRTNLSAVTNISQFSGATLVKEHTFKAVNRNPPNPIRSNDETRIISTPVAFDMPSFTQTESPQSQGYVSIVKRACVLDNGIVFDNRQILIDHWACQRAYNWMATDCFGRHFPQTHRLLPGWHRTRPEDHLEVVAVAQGHSPNNYFHFLTHIALKVVMLSETLSGSKTPLFVPCALPFQQEILEALGIPSCSLVKGTPSVPFTTYKACWAGNLVIPSWIDPQFPPKELVIALQNTLNDAFDLEQQRHYNDPIILLIKRPFQNRRRDLANHDELLMYLETEFGCSVVELDPGKSSVREQACYFSRAKAVVSVHGAALANLVFCPPRVDVIEIFNPQHIGTHYWHLANILDLQYHFITMDRDKSGFVVDCKAIVRYLRSILREP